MYFVLASCLISAFYSLIAYDWVTRLNVIGFVAIALELTMKIYSIRHANIVVGLVEKLIGIFKVNEKVSLHNRQEMLERFSTFTEYLFKVGALLYILATTGYFIYPLYRYIYFQEIIPLLPAFLPGIDENTRIGFIIITIAHLNYISYGLLGSACSDFSFTMVIVNVPVLGKIMGYNIIDLNELVVEKPQNTLFVKAELKNILLQHLEITEFIDSLDTTFFKICLVQIGCGAFAMSALLFLCLRDNYLPAYGFSIAFFFQIISYCAIGTVIEVSNDEIYENIVRCDWFLMACVEQRKYQLLMLYSQKAKSLTVGGVAPLNMSTCVKIFKTVYSYLMILYTFIA